MKEDDFQKMIQLYREMNGYLIIAIAGLVVAISALFLWGSKSIKKIHERFVASQETMFNKHIEVSNKVSDAMNGLAMGINGLKGSVDTTNEVVKNVKKDARKQQKIFMKELKRLYETKRESK